MRSETTQSYEDPFAGAEKHPAISWKDKPIGTKVTGIVTAAPKLVQARDYDTGDPAFWPDGNEKKTVVTELEIGGEIYSLWAAKPGALYAAMAAAQSAAKTTIAPGGRLTVTFIGEKPDPARPRLNPQKLYEVTYSPPDAFTDYSKPVDEEPPF